MVVKRGIYPQIKWVDKWMNHIIIRVWNHATHQVKGCNWWRSLFLVRYLGTNFMPKWHFRMMWRKKKTKHEVPGKGHIIETEGSSKVMDYQIKGLGCPVFCSQRWERWSVWVALCVWMAVSPKEARFTFEFKE